MNKIHTYPGETIEYGSMEYKKIVELHLKKGWSIEEMQRCLPQGKREIREICNWIKKNEW